jgi:phosphocarrier protein
MLGNRYARTSCTALIVNERGLHARAAAKFVKCVSLYQAEVSVIKDDQEISGRSIMGLMMLSASKGSELMLAARGPDAKAVLAALCHLIETKFGEPA